MREALDEQRFRPLDPREDPTFSRLVDDLPDAVAVIGSDGTVRWANHSAEKLFRRSLKEWIGVSGLELVHPEDLELVLRSLVTIQEKEVGTAIEVRVAAADGWRLMEVVGAPVSWFEEGAVLLCMRDVTERRRYELASSEEARFRSLVQNSAAVTMLVSREGAIESVSGALTRLLGHDPEWIERRPLAEIVDADDRTALASALDLATLGASAANPVTIELKLLRHSGDSTVPFQLAIVNLLDDPTVGGFVISALDITARSLAENRLRNALSLLTATLDSTADGILVTDCSRRVTSYNRRFTELFRMPNAFLEERDHSIVTAFVANQLSRPEPYISKIEELYAMPEAEADDILEFTDGRVMERHSRPQKVEGNVVGRVWSFRDVTDRKRLEDELSYQAFHDSLTGLANKALFQDRLEHATARLERTQGHLTVLFIDLDNFKTVNDSLGHAAGDELLRRVADVLVGCLRKIDTAARLGGDEFAVLVEDVVDQDDAIKLAERILAALRQPMAVGTKEMAATVSIGITFDSPGITSDQLLRNADLAMYKAKEKGKNRFEQFENDMHATALARLEVQAHLETALEGRELIVHYQPIFDLYSDSIVGFEALARWRHPTRGLLAPVSFIPFAEETDLINKIDSFVLAEACKQARKWQVEFSEHLSISVNISSRRLIDTTLPDDVAYIVAQAGLSPASLVLEITESAVMRDTEIAAQNLRLLRSSGIRIALDDFGTGYSSLSYLEHLPIDILKIDKSFVATIKDDRGEVGLAPAIVQLAQTLGHIPVAEGVESAAQALALRRLGCRLAQGFHLGLPKDADATRIVLQSSGPAEPRAWLGSRTDLTPVAGSQAPEKASADS
jgi:diguanylate cyclase (GGDEF)-like protein/PAS domain S-box-containing protein